MKYLIGFLLIFSVNSVFANTVCKGETHKGTLVTVKIYTVGSYGAVSGGEVFIMPVVGEAEYYNLEVINYYESVLMRDGSEYAMVGLSAGDVAGDKNYVKLRYFDENGKDKPSKNGINYMDVWNPKSDKNGGSNFFKFKEVKCTVELDA